MSLRLSSQVDQDEIICHRLFFALKPGADAVAEIADERSRIRAAKSYVADHRLHLTLWYLDMAMSPTPGTIARLSEAVAKVRGPALRLVLNEVVSNGHNALLRPGEPMPVLKAFQQRLQLALAAANIWPNRGFRFDPHVTLAYGAEESFRRQIWPISWRCEDYVLIHSLVGLTEHVELGRWSLEG